MNTPNSSIFHRMSTQSHLLRPCFVQEVGKFAMAVCELSGQLLVYDEDKYADITEDEVVAAMEEVTHRAFSAAYTHVLNLFSGDK